MIADYVCAILALIIGIIGAIYLSKNNESKVSDSRLSSLNYWKLYIGLRIMILLGVLWIIKLTGIVNL